MSRALRRLAAGLAGLVCAGLGCWLVWRIAVVSDRARSGEQASVEQLLKEQGRVPDRRAAPAAVPRTGITGVTMRYFDPRDGRLVMIVRAARGDTDGELCRLHGVRLERLLDREGARILAAGRSGVYNRKTGSGGLRGEVLVRRMPAGAERPDMVIRGEQLDWTRGAAVLTSDDYVDFSWIDPHRGYALSARGRGMVAERRVRRVLLGEDVSVSIRGSALPAGMDLGGKLGLRPGRRKSREGPVTTVVTCDGPATFEYELDAGRHRARFGRGVVVRVRSAGQDASRLSLDCDDLEVLLRAEGAVAGGDSPVLNAARAAAAAPMALPATSRWLADALLRADQPRPAPRPGGGRGPRPAGGDESAAGVDLVVARGAVVLRAPEGVARGRLLWYDHPAGVLWLEGGPGEAAELVPSDDHDQVVARRFFYNAATGEMRVPQGDRVTVTFE
jgi:hypothetical protein